MTDTTMVFISFGKSFNVSIGENFEMPKILHTDARKYGLARSACSAFM